MPPIKPSYRHLVNSLSTEDAHRKLKELDPSTNLTATDTQRVARALEVVLATKNPLKHWHNKLPSQRLNGRAIVIALEVAKPKLESKSLRRIKKIAPTALKEVAKMKNVEPSCSLWKACGVKEFWAHYQNRTTLTEAINQTAKSTYGYIGQQLTWLRHQPPLPNLIVKHPSHNFRNKARCIATLIKSGRI